MMLQRTALVLLFLSFLAPSAARAAEEFVSCDPVAVATFASRIHVRCAASVGGGIFYFAHSTQNAAAVQRVLTVLTAAQVAGRTLLILTDLADTSGTSIGCGAADCRPLRAASFGN
jgi:hypothetical protein